MNNECTHHDKLAKHQTDCPNFVNLCSAPNDDQFLAFAQPTNGWCLVLAPLDNDTRHFLAHDHKIKMWWELVQSAVVTGIAKRDHQTFANSMAHLNNNFPCNHLCVFDCIFVKRGLTVVPANNNANDTQQVVQTAVLRAVPAAVQIAMQQELQPASVSPAER